jgi:hypothetical protein
MKLKIRIAMIIGVVFCLVSCKTENKYPIVGTWGELKLRTYQQSYTGVITGDTTYVGPAFSHDDYAQFNINGNCTIQQYHHYYPTTLEGLIDLENAAPTITQYDFGPFGSKYVLDQVPVNYRGAATDTVSLIDGGGMLIHSTLDNQQYYIISDAYYGKEGQPL